MSGTQKKQNAERYFINSWQARRCLHKCVTHKSYSNQNQFTFSLDSFSLSSHNHSHKQFSRLRIHLVFVFRFFHGGLNIYVNRHSAELEFSFFSFVRATKTTNKVIICNKHQAMVLGLLFLFFFAFFFIMISTTVTRI